MPAAPVRAYGDAALKADNRVVDLQRLNRMRSFDPESGILHAEAGVTLDEIIRVFLPRGFFPPVVPGTRFVTLGGSIAADIHGKSHHRDSSLATHVLWFDLMLASGEMLALLARGEQRSLLGDSRRDGPHRGDSRSGDAVAAGRERVH